MIIIPAIDLIEGRPVRLLKGDFNNVTKYHPNPVEVAKLIEDAGAKWLHVVDLDAARGTSENRVAIEKIRKSVNVKIEVGGGVKTIQDAKKLQEIGVDKVIIGSAIVADPELPEKWNNKVNVALIAGIDADNGKVKVSGWQKSSLLTDIQLANKLSHQPIGGIIYTNINRDGTLNGPDLHRSILVAQSASKPVVLSGGVGSEGDVDLVASVQNNSIVGLIIGKAWYEGKVTLKTLFKKYNQNEPTEWL